MPLNTQELWNRADALLDGLLDLATPEQRREALAKMSLDDDLRTAVEKLLAAHEAGGVLDRSRFGDFFSTGPGALSGKQLGRWLLEHEIGRGGMAVVYRAHAIDGSAQSAAVKILTLGAQAGRGNALFRQEQAVLARMRHPHIASLFESGIADDGTPWLAMALVEGVRIDIWCTQGRLSPGAIVALFIDVCEAVAYAHRNLVIHRDLKPSNVMVDQDGHVRLLDFGIARLADQDDGNTATEWRALTPDYAAPEQFSGAAPSIAMDVFGLGAVLYRLLSGQPPRADGIRAETAITAPSRIIAAVSVSNQIRGDLDAVVLKALDPDPAQRHESVSALIQDLRAWQDGRPVSARTLSTAQRVARFVKRHAVTVTASLLIVLSILTGAGIAIWQAGVARTEAQNAREAAGSAKQAETRAKHELERAEAMRDFLQGLFLAAAPNQPPGHLPSTTELLETGARRAADEKLSADMRADIGSTIGRIYLLRGLPGPARDLIGQAGVLVDSGQVQSEQIQAMVLRARGELAASENDLNRAASDFDRSLALLARTAPASSEHLDVFGHRGFVEINRRDYGKAIEFLEAGLKLSRAHKDSDIKIHRRLLGALSVAYQLSGRHQEAAEVFRETVLLIKQLDGERSRSMALALSNSVGLFADLGQLQTAEANAVKAIEIYDEVFTTPSRYRAGTRSALASVKLRLGALDEAIALYEKADEESAQVIGVPVTSLPGRARVMGFAYAQLGHWKRSLPWLRQALEATATRTADAPMTVAEVEATQALALCSLRQATEGLQGLRHADDLIADPEVAQVGMLNLMDEARAACAEASDADDEALVHLERARQRDQSGILGDPNELLRRGIRHVRLLQRLKRHTQAGQLRDSIVKKLQLHGIDDHPLLVELLQIPVPAQQER